MVLDAQPLWFESIQIPLNFPPLRQVVEFEPAFDRHDLDHKDVGGVNLRMVAIGAKGAVQFLLYTNWMLPHVTGNFVPIPADLGYHSLLPFYKTQRLLTKSCVYLDNKPCYYDGSGFNAQRIFEILLEHGSAGVWHALTQYYVSVFENYWPR